MIGKFDLNSSPGGEFYYNLKANYRRIILTSHHYPWKAEAEADIALVRQQVSNDANFQRKRSKNDEPYFVLVASDGRSLGKSDMYSTSSAMEVGIKAVKANAPNASLINRSQSEKASN